MQETQDMWFGSLCQEDPLEESMATHSSILTGRIPWTEKPGELFLRQVRLAYLLSAYSFVDLPSYIKSTVWYSKTCLVEWILCSEPSNAVDPQLRTKAMGFPESIELHNLDLRSYLPSSLWSFLAIVFPCLPSLNHPGKSMSSRPSFSSSKHLDNIVSLNTDYTCSSGLSLTLNFKIVHNTLLFVLFNPLPLSPPIALNAFW